MRRSTQHQRQRGVARLASVPEYENEDEMAESETEEQFPTSSFQAEDPKSGVDQAAPVSGMVVPSPQLNMPQGPLPSIRLYNFCTNLRPPPLRYWRRKAWINCTRGKHPSPPIPPPPALVRADSQASAFPQGGVFIVDDTRGEGQVNGDGASCPADGNHIEGHQQKDDRQKDELAGMITRSRTPGCEITAPPQLAGPFRPPPPYSVAVAQKQQLAAAMQTSNEGETQDMAEFTVGHQSTSMDDMISGATSGEVNEAPHPVNAQWSIISNNNISLFQNPPENNGNLDSADLSNE